MTKADVDLVDMINDLGVGWAICKAGSRALEKQA